MADAGMTDVLIGTGGALLGVIIGSVVSIATTYGVAIRQERRETAKEVEKKVTELLTAARLVENELSIAHIVIKYLAADQKWAPSSVVLSTDAWDTHKEILARELTYTDWIRVKAAARGVGTYSVIRDDETNTTTNDDLRQMGETLSNQLREGIETLEHYVGARGHIRAG